MPGAPSSFLLLEFVNSLKFQISGWAHHSVECIPGDSLLVMKASGCLVGQVDGFDL